MYPLLVPDIRDFLAAARTVADASPSADTDALRIYFDAFRKYSSFDDLSDATLHALGRNLELVAADGYNLETKTRLLSIIAGLQKERLEKRRTIDDATTDPLFTRDYDTEQDYAQRVTATYPNIPAEFAADFLFRAHNYVTDKLSWLDFTTAVFRKETWSTDRIITDVKHPHPAGVEMEVEKFKTMPNCRTEYPLAVFMVKEGTWPKPLPVVDNALGLATPSGREVARFEAIDGMHSLGFLRAMIELGMSVRSEHELFLIRVAP